MPRTIRRMLVCSTLALSAIVSPARAQRPPGADTLSQQAVAESLAVLRQLAMAIRGDSRNAALWYRQGMVAWALYDRDRTGSGVADVDWTLIGRLADTSLRIAKSLEPRNPRYILGAGQYFLGTGLTTMRVQSYAMFGDALDIARGSDDAATHSEAALEVGRVYWRRYDAVANAGYTTSDAAEVRVLAQTLSSDTANHAKGADPERVSKTRPYTRRTLTTARRSLDRNAQRQVSGFPGEADYLLADRYLREAYEAVPESARAYRQLGMLLAERSRWTELEALAREQADIAPAQAWTWMTLGLATYRSGDTRTAREAFARGLALMSATERSRLDRIERVLRPSDAPAAESWTPAERAATELRYWRDADPLWSDPDIDPRTEFLARVSYAELRWTVEELAKRGADADRGIVYVRYGPPDRIASADGHSDWSYDLYHLQFRFRGAPTFGTASFADFGRAHDMMDSLPARWENTHLLQIDSVPSEVARFRATRDSMDVYFATRPPVERIRRAADVAGPVRGKFWLLGGDRAIVAHDSAAIITPGVNAFTRRLAVAPAVAPYDYRFEASATGSLVAGRSTGHIASGADPESGFPVSGFGVSDVLFATKLEAPRAPARRWRDVVLTPLAGPIARNAELSLLWENYDFGERGGATRYTVSVTIVRERSRTGRIAAQIVGALGSAVRRVASLDRVELHFDRSVAHAPIVVDFITLSLGGTPAGSYQVTLQVTDLVSGGVTQRRARLVIDG